MLTIYSTHFISGVGNVVKDHHNSMERNLMM